MTRKELIFDCMLILEACKITDDSRLNENYIGFKIDQKRAKEIRDTYKRNPVIEPIWLQDLGVCKTTPVNKIEDRAISICNCSFSKIVLPPIVSIVDNMSNQGNLGVHRLSSSDGSKEYFQMELSNLSLITPDSIQSKYQYYTAVGSSYYLTPIISNIRPVLILERPLDGYVLDDTDKESGTLVEGLVYEIRSGNITYNAVKYQKGQTFTATSTTTYTGPGKVFLQTQKRRMTDDDNYPMSSTMAEVVLQKIWTIDFGIEQSKILDAKNNTKDEQKVI